MSAWAQEVEAASIEEGREYFIALRKRSEMASYQFWSKGLNGKLGWSGKPGIAVRAVGNDKLRETLTGRPDCIAIPVPADADRRWTRRRPVFK